MNRDLNGSLNKKWSWKDKRLGLVLSGGGAKGAYQIGMLRAMEELGLAENIVTISGTSIGALGALIYSAAGLDGLRELFRCFSSQITEECRQTDAETIRKNRAAAERGEVSLEQFIEDPSFSEFHAGLFRDFLKELLPDVTLSGYRRKVYTCAYALEPCRPEYFHLNSLKQEEQRELVLASASLPFVFPPVEYRGGHYLDGGVVPTVCGPDAAPADKIPLLPVLGEEVDAILVNFLNPANTVDSSMVPEAVGYLELRPSELLEKYPGEGTLDFSSERLAWNEELGYKDTMGVFE